MTIGPKEQARRDPRVASTTRQPKRPETDPIAKLYKGAKWSMLPPDERRTKARKPRKVA